MAWGDCVVAPQPLSLKVLWNIYDSDANKEKHINNTYLFCIISVFVFIMLVGFF